MLLSTNTIGIDKCVSQLEKLKSALEAFGMQNLEIFLRDATEELEPSQGSVSGIARSVSPPLDAPPKAPNRSSGVAQPRSDREGNQTNR